MTFNVIIDWVCQDSVTDIDITADWYSLIWYAPFNTAWDLNLYKEWWEYPIISNYVSAWYTNQYGSSSRSNTSNLTSYWDVLNNSASFLESDWKKGILLTKDWEGSSNADVLKYTLPSSITSWDFAIEMNVLFPSSNPGTTRYLFQLGNYKAHLTYNWFIKLTNSTYDDFNISSKYDGNFHKITAIKEWVHYTLKMDWSEIWSFDSTNWVWTDLYIWSSSSKSSQINNIIDYVKIYK